MSDADEYAIVEAPREAAAAAIDAWVRKGFELVSHAVFYLRLEQRVEVAGSGGAAALVYSFVFRRKKT